MQRILGQLRKAENEFGMLGDGDVIAVGVSGGKDSIVLLDGLDRLSRFIGIDYRVVGITVDPRFGGVSGDYRDTEEFCRARGIEYHIIPTNIGEVVFELRKEENPCALCSRMRRGALCSAAEELGCNKIALGHHMDDVVETFLMKLFNEGQIGCFFPVTEISDKLTVIRPLVLATEKEIRRAVKRSGLPVNKSLCPADGHTERQKIKEFIREKNRESKGFSERVFGALRRSGIDGWGKGA